MNKLTMKVVYVFNFGSPNKSATARVIKGHSKLRLTLVFRWVLWEHNKNRCYVTPMSLTSFFLLRQ